MERHVFQNCHFARNLCTISALYARYLRIICALIARYFKILILHAISALSTRYLRAICALIACKMTILKHMARHTDSIGWYHESPVCLSWATNATCPRQRHAISLLVYTAYYAYTNVHKSTTTYLPSSATSLFVSWIPCMTSRRPTHDTNSHRIRVHRVLADYCSFSWRIALLTLPYAIRVEDHWLSLTDQYLTSTTLLRCG